MRNGPPDEAAILAAPFFAGFPRPVPGAVSRRPRRSEAAAQSGAVMVEFAFGLMFLFLLFTAYIKISEIFLAHERLRYATSAAARAHAVGGSASRAASAIDKDHTLSIKTNGSAQTVSLSKKVDLPEAVGKLFGETDGFTISHKVKTYMEPSPSGDN
jgi:Flp pilus assembly protein TadG